MEMALTIILMLANNKGYLETSLNMGFFDVTNDVPVELIFKGGTGGVDCEGGWVSGENQKIKNLML